MAQEWKNEFEERFVQWTNNISPILNEAHENKYKVFKILWKQRSEWSNKITTGTTIIFKRKYKVDEFEIFKKKVTLILDSLKPTKTVEISIDDCCTCADADDHNEDCITQDKK